ncbi:MAG: hypothetical protein JEZ09_06770 [Salinivirgaceae bacterium]|nr:hypothetical protein [Salinivirgaceae bacterium]
MTSKKIQRILWLAAIVAGLIGVLGQYEIVIIKFLSNYNFEFLLTAFILMVILKLMKK